MTTFKIEPLSGFAIEMVGQLYVNGPTWDGNVCSKTGRDELVRAGLAYHMHGYAFLTPDGVKTAVEWGMADLRRRNSKRWIEKRRQS